MPPSPPQAVEERLWLSHEAQKAQRLTRRLADSYDALADQWIARIEQNKAIGETISKPLSTEAGREFGEKIEELEEIAEHRAILRNRLRKHSQRQIKRQFARDPSLGAVSRTFAARLLATDDRVIESLLDFALYARALRAELSPASREGPNFNSPADLEAYLDRELAS